MTIVEELKARYRAYSSDFIDKKVEEWESLHPGEGLEGLRALYLTRKKQNQENSQFEIRPCFECNEKCIHCFNGDNERNVRQPSLEEIYKEVDKRVTEHTCCMIGGEPTLRKDLAVILKYIKEKGKEINLHTNGLRLSDKEYLDGIIPYIDFVTIPIHSSDFNVFDAITQVKGSAEKTLAVFKDIIKIKTIMVTTQTVINQLNYKTLLDTFNMIQDICPNINMMLTFPTPVGAAKSSKVTPKYSEIKDYIHPVLDRYGYLINVRDIPRCYLYPYQDDVMLINDDDHCTVEGDLNSRRMKIPGCASCIFNKDCSGVWKEYNELYPDLDLIPVK